ncbi:MAG: hypothetical protein Q9220_003293 [cf. Caloplaca sp. 1 TL-2023]
MARLAYNNLNTKLPTQTSRFHLESNKQELIDDESDSILDERILERSASIMSPHDMDQRRPSFTDNASTISPRPNRWNDFTFPASSTSQLHSSAITNPLYFDQGGHAFVQDPSSTGTMFPHASATWHTQADQDSSTPTATYDAFPSEPDVKSVMTTYQTDSLNPPIAGMYGGLPDRHAGPFYGANTLSTSPRSGHDWSSISSTEHIDLQPLPGPGALSSPTYNSNPPLLRRDGIRKKNARFEIPAERTLRTIDHLINQTTDEGEIKELKQQKRLLRNRQAALDSRQRKKQHTERLEEEKKTTSNMLSELEEALAEYKIREDSWARERESMMMYHQQYIDEMMAQKEDLVRRHTVETTELRKKNAYLADHAQRSEGIAMSAVPSSTGYSAEYSDFDHLTLESSPWDNFSLVPDFNMDGDQKADDSLVVAPKKEATLGGDTDATTAPGLLLMLLLCGAWVVSNNTSSQPGPISRMPEDVRMASTAVLDTIYSDNGIQPHALAPVCQTGSVVGQPSLSNQPQQHTNTAPDASNRPRSPLATLHRQLVSPTEQQQRDQIFSLTAEQFNGLTAEDDMVDSTPVLPSHRRNLGDALASLRMNNKPGAAAEAYTRSLMWNEVPGNIVRDFARMVAEAQDDHHRRQEPMV